MKWTKVPVQLKKNCIEKFETQNLRRGIAALVLVEDTEVTNKAVFGSRKSISGKYSIFQKCYFLERKMFSRVWLHFKKDRKSVV